MKKILFIMTVLALILVPYQASHAAAKPYDYELVYQSSSPATMQPGETANVWLEVKNTGTNTWWDYQDPAYAYHPVRLGTGSQYGSVNQQQDYASEFTDSTWLAPNRTTDTSPNVTRPGWNTRFQFNIKAPSTPGVYRAYFTPVVEGITWMKDIGIYWELTVGSGSSNGNTSFDTNNLDISQSGFVLGAEKSYLLSGESTTLIWGLNPFLAVFVTPDQLAILKQYMRDNVVCSIDNGIGNVDFEGSKLLSNITSSQTYNLTCTDNKTGKTFQSNVADGTGADIKIVSKIPPKVTGITSTVQPNGDILIQWDDVPGIGGLGYIVNYSSYPDFISPTGGIDINFETASTNSVTIKKDDSRFKVNTRYYLKVSYSTTVDSYSNVTSADSDIFSFTTSN